MPINSITREATGYLEDRKSRFFAYVVPFARFPERLTDLRSEHRKARHFVTAYRRILSDGRIVESGKDDGEPAGTSGIPTLKVLQGANLVDTAVIVVRYFGGIKLGGGGLARAYSGAAADAIAHAQLVPFERIARRVLIAGFADAAGLERRIADLRLSVVDRVFHESGVTIAVEGPEAIVARL
ncbi:MAG: YigZ family protein [Roseibium sp.]|nr:YigZ family protein [Roseibium sp.]